MFFFKFAKTNLEKLKKEQTTQKEEEEDAHTSTTEQEESDSQSAADSLLAALQYRDRAKERRKKYGTPEPPLPKYSSAPVSASSSSYAHKTKSRDRDHETESSYIESKSTRRSFIGIATLLFWINSAILIWPRFFF